MCLSSANIIGTFNHLHSVVLPQPVCKYVRSWTKVQDGFLYCWHVLRWDERLTLVLALCTRLATPPENGQQRSHNIPFTSVQSDILTQYSQMIFPPGTFSNAAIIFFCLSLLPCQPPHSSLWMDPHCSTITVKHPATCATSIAFSLILKAVFTSTSLNWDWQLNSRNKRRQQNWSEEEKNT